MTIIDRFLTTFRRSLRPSPAPPLLSPEELQRLFTARYRSFRELLAANTNTLEAMAELEKALRDGRTLSMTFIRARCTLVTVNVYKIIRNLNKISDGRYSELERIFSRLQQSIETLLAGDQGRPEGEPVLDLERIGRAQADLTGEKMANLGEAGSLAGIRIPPGFALTAVATRLFFQRNQLYPKINHIIQQLDITDLDDLHRKSTAIQEIIRNSPLPPELESLIFTHFDRLAASIPNLKVAVRSSALGEDLGQASFAGLYHTELDVGRDTLVSAYKSVLASKYTPRAISYRLAKGFRHEQTEMCVGFLAMIGAATSGICYSRSIGGRGDTLDLFFAPGSAKGIVDGTRSTIHLLMERTAPHRIVQRLEAEDALGAWLTDTQAVSLAEIGMQLEYHFGAPQDIEWSIDPAGTLFILQSRPISAAAIKAPAADQSVPADERAVLYGGVTGCAGTGCGPVFIVRSPEDMLHFPNRAVLVVRHPLPEWAPLLKRAAALVAETGSEAGHLATLSREFGLPSLLALDRATEILTNGETVTVDAANRAIYRGRIEELLHDNGKHSNLMDGSPVQQTLISVLKLISPLNLTDPASPDFHACRCRTLHDITRFCHEKSVSEMFDFGKRYHFDKGTAKRLHNTLPIEWWVIDLGEGFQPGYDVRRTDIAITDITCPPMQAIWEGMHAVAWEGPPAARLRTMVSFLFQSAVHNGLDPSHSSALREKNYFLISKNYCNLSVRLGYHYAMIEAMLGNRPVDRYITFRFKGGAAVEDQRVQRIELLAEVLEQFDYRVERIGDALMARVERETERFVADRLKILGYLTLHTRQLDMVMADAGSRQFFRDKFIQEIGEMLNHE
ncbi:PEP/pyruvate-binding domain-containing protein [uncultured Desulfobulbus sp.]|uniref:PEP/pyruvate-binding domain-containing protein n=1 Tax=uncultured Desulfobulbus sp. TaxID=239745 RepID=UPI0029C6835C|nr:PEP/pyruvate-binding domain-containing protein [uncultured Desulfobulbus sp.]